MTSCSASLQDYTVVSKGGPCHDIRIVDRAGTGMSLPVVPGFFFGVEFA